MKNVLCALVLSLFATAVHAQSGPIPVRLESVSGTPQTVWVNAVLPEPFVARVVRTDTGAPVAGVRVGMENNSIMCMPLHPTCVPPPRSMYGQFESGLSVSLLSDAQGLVTAPAYRAGTTEGRYSV